MANIIPHGRDETTGQSRPIGPGDSLVDSTGGAIVGLQGNTGISGVTGIFGNTGIIGLQGSTGILGNTGAGTAGPQGATGISGTSTGYVLSFVGMESGTVSGDLYAVADIAGSGLTGHPIPVSGNVTAVGYNITGGTFTVTTPLGNITTAGNGVITGSSAVTAGNNLTIGFSVTGSSFTAVVNVYIMPS